MGPGGNEHLADYGDDNGTELSDPGLPDFRVSDDTYRGFASGTGSDAVRDHEGASDMLDLRPLESSGVHFEAVDFAADDTRDSLRVIVSDTSSVLVVGHFSPIVPQEDGRMERIVFSNETLTSAAELKSLM